MKPLRSCLILAAFALIARGEEPVEGITFSGRVVEVESKQPIAGAVVVVARSIPGIATEDAPPFVKETTLTTDAEGRFSWTVTPEEIAEPRLQIAIARVMHPDFVARKSSPVPLVSLLRGREFGDQPFFETITLERGMIYKGRIVNPEGNPGADVPYQFGNWRGSNRAENFTNLMVGQTDAEGRFHLRMPETEALTIILTPDEFAPYIHFFGTAERAKHPDVRVPADLGTIQLEPGSVLKGRLLNLQGRPMAGARVVAIGRNNDVQREATTQDDGSFAFAPLRPGNYAIIGEGQRNYMGIDPRGRSMPPSAPVFRPALIYFKKDQAPAPVELRELPTVRVAVRFIDSHGRPARGGPVNLYGMIPGGQAPAQAPGGGFTIRLASEVNKEEPEDPDKRLFWNCLLVPDANGRLVFRAPKGLENAGLYSVPPDETLAYKFRLKPDAPLRLQSFVELGTLDGDHPPIEIISDRSPTVLATVKTEDGLNPVFDVKVFARFNVHGGENGGDFIKQADGRYRSVNLLPDQEYEIYPVAPGFAPNLVERVTLPEGATNELTLILRTTPRPPRVGDPVPPFLVKTLDGPPLGLSDFRGKFLLLHAWVPTFGTGRDDLGRLKTIQKQFADDQRLALLGLCLANGPDDAGRTIKTQNLNWPQAVLRDRLNDPIAIDYGLRYDSGVFLIGPDGRLVARDLKGPQITEELEKALGKE